MTALTFVPTLARRSKHRAKRPVDSRPTARCNGRHPQTLTCPRHQPEDYAEMAARHATDSIIGRN